VKQPSKVASAGRRRNGKQFEFQMHEINNKIDNEKKREKKEAKAKAEFKKHLFSSFQFIQKPLFTRFFIIIAILKASFGNNERGTVSIHSRALF
jgi:hypothetical protein